MKGGYTGKILEVDLSNGKIVVSELASESILRKYLGGFGLGIWLLYHRCLPGIAALDF